MSPDENKSQFTKEAENKLQDMETEDADDENENKGEKEVGVKEKKKKGNFAGGIVFMLEFIFSI